jgi:hypothetical protein
MAHIFYINDLHNMKRSLYKMSWPVTKTWNDQVF